MFSSKKREIKDPQELAEFLESRAKEIQGAIDASDSVAERVASMERTVARVTAQEGFVNSLSAKVDALIQKLSAPGGDTVLDTLKRAVDLEDRQKLADTRLVKLEEQLRSWADQFDTAQTKWTESDAGADIVRGKVSDMEQEIGRFRVMREKLESLNSLSEYVKTKISSLEKQPWLLTRPTRNRCCSTR